jgi:hypothetical protein
MVTIMPLSSATEMQCPGGTRPSSGLCHRIKASAPTTLPLARSICGWYLAGYEWDEANDLVRVARICHQRESGYSFEEL